jgi:signal transduction histidine kinase
MPETIRAANERLRSRPKRGGLLAAFVITNTLLASVAPARADTGSALDILQGLKGAVANLTGHDADTVGLAVAAVCVAALVLIVAHRARRHAQRRRRVARNEASALNAEIDRLKALLLAEPQVLVEWPAASDQPSILGDTAIILWGARPERVLAFGTWLEPAAARDMEHAVETLRSDGRGFAMTLTSAAGRPIEAEGRVVAGRAVLRLRDIGGIEQQLVRLAERHDKLQADVNTMAALLDTLPAPVWARDPNGRLTFVNAAYARAVEAVDADDAVMREIELLDRPAREALLHAQAAHETYAARLPAIAAGQRRIFDVVAGPSGQGSAGIAIDRTEVEAMRAEHDRSVDAHRRVLDQLATGVAIFNAERKLIFYNSAFRALFEIDAGFLDQAPSDNDVLDRLRSDRKLPEESDFRQWRSALHEAYRAVEPQEHMWFLPDGRTLRIVTAPNPEGGVTYLYDDVTERLDLHRRYDALIKVQGETLDHLKEAVAVFGSDGRIRLHNPAFQRLWKLAPDALDQHPHVEQVTAWCQALHDDGAVWRNLRAAVTAIDGREPVTARIERRDGEVIDLATMPLPDGATLVTFQTVTDTVNVERALRERNEALETADRIKIDFVHHVSYELRSPLTNIIGFANLLGDDAFGPLTDKQREYLGYITTSTNALLAIINNILDLATIDAGAMNLNLGHVDIRACMEAAAEGVQDRLVNENLRLDIAVPSGIGGFVADERRLRQILFNLLSNAVGFSPAGGTITLAAQRRPDAVVFTVSDQGPGIPPDLKDRVFDWFETDPLGSQHRGPGLGLSLVRSFVELHGGTVSLESAAEAGTTVTCVFPTQHTERQSAA